MAVLKIESTGSDTLERVNKIMAGFPSGAYKAVWGAMRRATASAKTEAGRFAAGEYNISKGTFMARTAVKTRMSGGSGGVASVSVTFSGQVIPLIAFGAKGGPGGVSVTVKRNGGHATLGRAFQAAIYGNVGIWEREGRPRFPVEQLYGPSTGHMMQNENVVEQMDETIERVFSARLEHEMLRLMNGWGG